MSDVYKFRVTVDLELATHDTPKVVREFIKSFVDEALDSAKAKFDQEQRGEVVEFIHRYDVRVKRLDDDASIGPDLTLHVAASRCPHCGKEFPGQPIHQMPFRCPFCKRVIRLTGEGQVMP